MERIITLGNDGEIIFNPDKGEFNFNGSFICENVEKYFTFFKKAWERFINTWFLHKKEIKLFIKLDYLNTSSSKYFYEILKEIPIHNLQNHTYVNWYVEEDDYDMLDLIDYYKDLLEGSEFIIHKKEESCL